MNKKQRRLRRANRRARRSASWASPRLSVHRTPQHIYAQVFDAEAQGARRGVDRAEGRRAKASRAPATSTRRQGRSARRSPSARKAAGIETGRVRSLGLQVSRPRQGARRRRARSRPGVLGQRSSSATARMQTMSQTAGRVHREAGRGQPRRRRSSRAAGSSASPRSPSSATAPAASASASARRAKCRSRSRRRCSRRART